MTFSDAVALYLEELRRRNYSERTCEEYAYDLGAAQRFLAEKNVHDAEAVASSALTDYQRWLFNAPTAEGKYRSVGTQNKKLAPVKGLFRFLRVEGVIIHDPARDLEYGREPRRLPRQVLTPQEARKILEAIDTGTVKGYRARTIMEVFYATGIRRSELINLRVGNVNLEEELLRINDGKGGHDRVVPLSAVACRYLETYIKGIRPKFVRNPQDDHLFLSTVGTPMYKDSLNYMIKLHARRAGVKKHVTCHVWRHTCATHLVKNRANLRHVQEMLGHRSLATTEKYLSLTITDLKEAHRRFHPREKETGRDGRTLAD